MRNVYISDSKSSVFKNLLYLHSTNGIGYTVRYLTEFDDLKKKIPENVSTHHQKIFLILNILYDHGGLWIEDDNTFILNSLDLLFEKIKTDPGFILQVNDQIHVLGSQPKTKELFQTMETHNFDLEHLYPYLETHEKDYPEIGKLHTYENRLLFFPKDLNHPSLWKTECFQESINNMQWIDYDFIEIGTSNFETCIQECSDETIGLSVEPLKYYLDKLPEKKNVKKINIGISDQRSIVDIYYIPEKTIVENHLNYWWKGCNSINHYHPLHLKYNVSHFCEIDKINVIPTYELFYTNKVRTVKYLKIDTEGHDCIILKSLYEYLNFMSDLFYPKRIMFESNEHTLTTDVDEIVYLYVNLGYRLEHRGYDTILIYS